LTGINAKECRDGEIELSDGTVIPCGLVVWSTGIKPTKFISSLSEYPQDFSINYGRLLVDEYMRVLRPGRNPREGFFEPHRDIFAIGDCAVSSTKPLPTLGVVAKW
jgi:NADH:ubiquinone reductase (non-electrogenic)